jgi:hypothetical protein
VTYDGGQGPEGAVVPYMDGWINSGAHTDSTTYPAIPELY